jgi:DnaJ-class molecular chaperone
MNRDLMIPCPTCNGDGFVSFEDRHVENKTEACRTCHGHGSVLAATGQTPQTSAAPDGGLHPTFRHATKASDGSVEVRDGSGNDAGLVNTGVPNTGSFHSGD